MIELDQWFRRQYGQSLNANNAMLRSLQLLSLYIKDDEIPKGDLRKIVTKACGAFR